MLYGEYVKILNLHRLHHSHLRRMKHMVSVRCTWLLSAWIRPNIPCCTSSSSFSGAPLRLAMMLAALCFIWSSAMSINVCRAPKMLRSMSTLQLPWSIDDCIKRKANCYTTNNSTQAKCGGAYLYKAARTDLQNFQVFAFLDQF